MKLVRTLTANQTKTMTVATRHGDTVTVYGSKGDTYQLMPFVNSTTGELQYACSCGDYIYRRAKEGTECKHAPIAHQLRERNS